MLQLVIPISPEEWDEEKEEFIVQKTVTLQLEHSLLSLSKWESKWKKPFLNQKEMTSEETMDYIKFMTVTKNVDPEVYEHITEQNVQDIVAYIKDPMTATTFPADKKSKSREIVTAELIYYWMISLQIPDKFEKWHLNRLMTLIRVFDIKNQPKKKMSQRELMQRNHAINEANKKLFNTRG